MNVNGKSRSNKLRVAYEESRGHRVHKLPCGAIGTTRVLFHLARLTGFDGAESTFWQRLEVAGGRLTLAELSKPIAKAQATTKKRMQSGDVIAAMKALDARKAAIKDAAR